MVRYALFFSFMLSLGFASNLSAQVLSCTYEQDGIVKSFENKPPQMEFSFYSDENDFFLRGSTVEYPNVWVSQNHDTAPDGTVYFTGYEVAQVYNEWEYRIFEKWGQPIDGIVDADQIWTNATTDVFGIFKLNPEDCSVELVWEDKYPTALGQPAVSPDGTMLVFDKFEAGSGWGTRDLYLLDLVLPHEPMKIDLSGMGNFAADWSELGIVFTHIDHYNSQQIWVLPHISAQPMKYPVAGYQAHWTTDDNIIFKEIKTGLGYPAWQPEFRMIQHGALGLTGMLDTETGEVTYTDATTTNVSESGDFWTSLRPLYIPALEGTWPACPPFSIKVQTIESEAGEGIHFTLIYSETIPLEVQATCQKEVVANSWAFKNGLVDEFGNFIDD